MSSTDETEKARTPEEINAAWVGLESRSTTELFALTLTGDYDDENPWDAVSVLRRRGTLEVFEKARDFCSSENPKVRQRGLDVLAQIGAGRPDGVRPYATESVSIAIRCLADPDPGVISSAAWALSHLRTETAIVSLISLRSHPDPDIREAVARCTELAGSPDGVSALIGLMEDDEEIVRDWATFAIGNFGTFVGGEWYFPDSPGIRAALNKRLQDPYEDAQREAIWGLAKRKDPVGLKLLLEHLESEDCWVGDQCAAEETLNCEGDTPVEDLCQGLRRLLAER